MSKLSHSAEYKKSKWATMTPAQKKARVDYVRAYRKGFRKGKACKPIGESAKWAAFTNRRNGAIRRGLAFSLTLEDFLRLSGMPCHYCGVAWSVETKKSGMNGAYRSNGIDRQDNRIGYVLDNCVPCCWSCNRLKWNGSLEDMISNARRLVEFQEIKRKENSHQVQL